jgi:hypothetical protein
MEGDGTYRETVREQDGYLNVKRRREREGKRKG